MEAASVRQWMDRQQLRRNPFADVPLSSRRASLFAGHGHLVGQLENLLALNERNFIALLGDSGIGKRSAARRASSGADLVVEMLAEPKREVLSELYWALLAEPPTDSPQRNRHVLAEMFEAVGTETVVVICDASHLELDVQKTVLSQLHHNTVAFPITVLVTCETLNPLISPLFSHQFTLQPLDLDGTNELMQRRIASVAERFQPPPREFGMKVHEITEGNPGEIVRLLSRLVEWIYIEDPPRSDLRDAFLQWIESGGEMPVTRFAEVEDEPNIPLEIEPDRVREIEEESFPERPPVEPESIAIPTSGKMHLNEQEREIIEVVGEYQPVSPSDPRLLDRFGITRSRLSQIFNGLQRRGVLSSKTVSRRRYYRLKGDFKN